MGPKVQLRHEREMRGWSQAKVAEALGTSAKIVSRWECGISLPSPYFREKLCLLFEKDALALGLLQAEKPVIPQQGRAAPPEMVPPVSVETPGGERKAASESFPGKSAVPRESRTLKRVAPSRKQEKFRRFNWLLVFRLGTAPLLLLLLAALWSYKDPIGAFLSAQQEAAQQSELKMEAQVWQQKHIGISSGLMAFDTYSGRSDTPLKEMATADWRHNETSNAVDLFEQTITMDPTDGEAQIYNENLHIFQRNTPWVSIVLGLPIDSKSNDLVIARADLQAAFLAQHEVNTQGLLPDGLQLRLLIANTGADDGDVAQIAQFIRERVNLGNADHLIAVVGWPYSAQTIDARDIIAATRLPLVSQSASATSLSGSSPFFFRVNPSDSEQGKDLAELATQTFHARRILVFRDSRDAYSSSLANAFIRNIETLGGSVILSSFQSAAITDGTPPTTVAQYETDVRTAASQGINLLFIAGLDIDAIRLAHAVGEVWRSDMPSLAHLAILGGDAIDTVLVLGQGTGQDAGIARQFPQDMRRLHFTSFGNPNEWGERKPPFFQEWTQTYVSPMPSDAASQPQYDAMLTYDTVQVLVHAVMQIRGPLNGQAVRNALVSLGHGKIPAYQGVSGLISFDRAGDPVDKAIVVLSVTGRSGGNEIMLSQVFGNL